jgi:hypothetical protein
MGGGDHGEDCAYVIAGNMLVVGLRAQVVVDRGPQRSRALWTGDPESVRGADLVYIAPGRPMGDKALSVDANTAGLGWVQSWVPRIEGDTLLQIQIGVRSD